VVALEEALVAIRDTPQEAALVVAPGLVREAVRDTQQEAAQGAVLEVPQADPDLQAMVHHTAQETPPLRPRVQPDLQAMVHQAAREAQAIRPQVLFQEALQPPHQHRSPEERVRSVLP
jgi:hypothetical protein